MRSTRRLPGILLSMILATSLPACGSDPAEPLEEAPPGLKWATTAGGAGIDYGTAIVAGADGSIYIGGFFRGEAAFGTDTLTSAGNSDAFVARYDDTGRLIWTIALGGPDADAVRALALDDQGRVWAAGSYGGTVTLDGITLNAHGPSDRDIFIARVDVDGTVTSAYTMGGPDLMDEPRGVTVGANGNVHVAGFVETSLDFGGSKLLDTMGGIDGFWLSMTPGGTPVVARVLGGSELDQVLALAMDSDDNVIVAGQFRDTTTIGDTTLTSGGGGDVFLARYTDAGDLLWAWAAGSEFQNDYAEAVATVDGSVYVAGTFYGTMMVGGTTLSAVGNAECFVVALDLDGNVRWARAFGGFGHDYASTLATAPDGGVYVGGRFFETMSIGGATLTGTLSQSYIARVRSGGSFSWAQSGGGADNDGVYELCVTPDGGLAIVGTFRESVTYGTRTLDNRGFDDAFLLRTGASGWK